MRGDHKRYLFLAAKTVEIFDFFNSKNKVKKSLEIVGGVIGGYAAKSLPGSTYQKAINITGGAYLGGKVGGAVYDELERTYNDIGGKNQFEGDEIGVP